MRFDNALLIEGCEFDRALFNASSTWRLKSVGCHQNLWQVRQVVVLPNDTQSSDIFWY